MYTVVCSKGHLLFCLEWLLAISESLEASCFLGPAFFWFSSLVVLQKELGTPVALQTLERQDVSGKGNSTRLRPVEPRQHRLS